MDRLHHQAGNQRAMESTRQREGLLFPLLAPETSKDHFDVVQCTGLASQLL